MHRHMLLCDLDKSHVYLPHKTFLLLLFIHPSQRDPVIEQEVG